MFADLVTPSISIKYASPCTLNWGHKQNIFTTTFVLQTSFSNNYAINFFPRLDRPSWIISTLEPSKKLKIWYGRKNKEKSDAGSFGNAKLQNLEETK